MEGTKMGSVRKCIVDQDDAYEDPRTYRTFVEDEFRFAHDPRTFPTLDAVIEHILTHISTLRADGLKEWDLVVWQECRVVAVIRTGSGGEPTVTVFGGT
jgi:hypothetical protein